MKTLILAKRINLGLEVLEAIVRTERLEIKSTSNYVYAKLTNGDTVEIRLTSTILRGLKTDIIYVPNDIDADDLTLIIPILMISEYKDNIRRYSDVYSNR